MAKKKVSKANVSKNNPKRVSSKNNGSKTKKKSGPDHKTFALIAFGTIIIVLAVVFGLSRLSTPSTNTTYEEEVVIELYAMSLCPYGVQAENSIIPVVKDFNGAVSLNINYIVSDLGGGKFRSLHGEPEVLGDIAQLCVADISPEKQLDFILCQNADAGKIPGNWESCANKLNIDVESLRSCYEGDQGKELLSESAEKTGLVGATSSPTIIINGEEYGGARDERSLKLSICPLLEQEHDECDGLGVVEVEVIVVNDAGCDSCDTSRILSISKSLFSGLVVTEVDANSETGKKLIENLGLDVAPVFLFDPAITETFVWGEQPKIAGAFEQVGKYYKLKDVETGANYYFDDEKQAAEEAKFNQYIDDNIAALGYDGSKPRLDYFVMAFCPYGNPADQAASELYDFFGDEIELVPHYIISVSGDSVNSLHGEQEGNQGVRELCAFEELGFEAFFDFTLKVNELCNYQNVDTCWETAADEVGLDKQVISDCESSRKLEIAAREDALINSVKRTYNGQLIPPQVSPTFLINGATYEGARDSTSLKVQLCALFDEAPDICKNTIESDTSAPVTGGCS